MQVTTIRVGGQPDGVDRPYGAPREDIEGRGVVGTETEDLDDAGDHPRFVGPTGATTGQNESTSRHS